MAALLEQLFAVILAGIQTGSPALCATFAILWWLERRERRESHALLAGLTEKVSALTSVLSAMKERLR